MAPRAIIRRSFNSLESRLSSGPSFDHPPVVEVALGVQFEPIENLSPAATALYWERIRAEFPRWSQRAPLATAFETFGPPMVSPVGVSLSVANAPGPMRSMFEDKSGYDLLQVQHDRFIRNWRKYDDNNVVYPRYDVVRENFKEALGGFKGFLGDEGVGEFVPVQCEVTYVNHIESGAAWERHGELAEVLEGFTGEHSDDFLGEPEAVDLNLRYVIPGDDGDAVGRLRVAVRPAHRLSDGRAIFKIDLTARTVLNGGGVDQVLEELDRGHHFLVNAFRALTSKKMHKLWGLH